MEDNKGNAIVAVNKESVVSYESNGQQITLDFQTVKDLIAIGGNVSDREILVFMNKCKFNGLNPFLNEAYLIKFGDVCQMVTGKETFLKRSDLDSRYKGFKAGVIVLNSEKKLVYREGTIYIKGVETLIGGWCEVYKDTQETPVRVELLFSEYSTGKSSWNTKPALMIRKCAIVGAHREAFPNMLSDIFERDEIAKDIMIRAEKAPVDEEKVSDAMEDLRKKSIMDQIENTQQVKNAERPKNNNDVVTICETDEFNGKYRCRSCGNIKIEKDMKNCPNKECGKRLIWVLDN